SALQRAEFDLAQIRGAFRGFLDFESLRTKKTLQSDVESAKIMLAFQTLQLQADEARLAEIEKQIAQCTIRAPHDGLVILAHKAKRRRYIEVGRSVKQNQDLIYLPDISRLEVQIWLPQTVIGQVRPGMRALVRTEDSPR